MEWLKLPLSLWFLATRDMPPAKRSAFLDETISAVLGGKQGVNSVSDWILNDSTSYHQSRIAAGKLGGRPKKAKISESSPFSDTPEKKVTFSNGPKKKPIEEKREEENNAPFGSVSRACARETGDTPAPQVSHVGQHSPPLPPNLPPGLADALAVAMKGAPLSPAQALNYAFGEQCGGLTPAQVLEWAEWNAERGWSRDLGGHLHLMTAPHCKASLRRWRDSTRDLAARNRIRQQIDEALLQRVTGGKVISDKGGLPQMEF